MFVSPHPKPTFLGFYVIAVLLIHHNALPIAYYLYNNVFLFVCIVYIYVLTVTVYKFKVLFSEYIIMIFFFGEDQLCCNDTFYICVLVTSWHNQ